MLWHTHAHTRAESQVPLPFPNRILAATPSSAGQDIIDLRPTSAPCRYSSCHLIGSRHHAVIGSNLWEPYRSFSRWSSRNCSFPRSASVCGLHCLLLSRQYDRVHVLTNGTFLDSLHVIWLQLWCGHLNRTLTDLLFVFIFFLDVYNLVLDNCSVSDRGRWWIGQNFFFFSLNLVCLLEMIVGCPDDILS